MKILYLLILLCLLAFQYYYPQVTINIPADYPIMQEGINAAFHGDIVLVAEGKYYENINFCGLDIKI